MEIPSSKPFETADGSHKFWAEDYWDVKGGCSFVAACGFGFGFGFGFHIYIIHSLFSHEEELWYGNWFQSQLWSDQALSVWAQVNDGLVLIIMVQVIIGCVINFDIITPLIPQHNIDNGVFSHCMLESSICTLYILWIIEIINVCVSDLILTQKKDSREAFIHVHTWLMS